MQTKQTFEVQIPFAGFYASAHDSMLESAFDNMLSDREGRGDKAHDRLYRMALDAVSWGDVYRDYARVYANNFLAEFGLNGEFKAMESPKYYNFETDRLYVEIDRASVAKIIRRTDPAKLTEVATRRHTSRSGFISFYSPDWKSWGRISTWDHNQLETLLIAYLETERGEEWNFWVEVDLMEGGQCNGYFDDWIWCNASPDLARAVNAWEYLQTRAKRGN